MSISVHMNRLLIYKAYTLKTTLSSRTLGPLVAQSMCHNLMRSKCQSLIQTEICLWRNLSRNSKRIKVYKGCPGDWKTTCSTCRTISKWRLSQPMPLRMRQQDRMLQIIRARSKKGSRWSLYRWVIKSFSAVLRVLKTSAKERFHLWKTRCWTLLLALCLLE